MIFILHIEISDYFASSYLFILYVSVRSLCKYDIMARLKPHRRYTAVLNIFEYDRERDVMGFLNKSRVDFNAFLCNNYD